MRYFFTILFWIPGMAWCQEPRTEDASAETSGSLAPTVVENPGPAPEPRRAASPLPPLEVAAPGQPAPLAEVATVVATRTPRLDVPSTQTVPASELRDFQRFSVTDALRRGPGISFTQNGGEGSLSALRIRGMESDQNLVLLNGRRLPPGLAGIYQIEYLDVSTLESVQILRGPAGSLYGSEAMGGVIDLRSADARLVENNGLSLYTEGGSFRTIRHGGAMTLREGPLGLSLEGAGIGTAGYRPESDFDNRTVRGNLAWDLADGAWIDFLGYWQDSDLQVPGDSRSPGFPANELNLNRSFLLSPRLTIERENWDLSLFYSHNHNELQDLNAPFFFDSLLRQNGRQTEAQFNIRPNDEVTLTAGAASYQFGFERAPIAGSFTPPSEQSYRYHSLFAQADAILPARIRLTASARHDWYDVFEDAATWSVAAEKEIGAAGTRLFGKLATGYRVPSGQDILFTINDINDFEPEESRGWEAGLRQPIFEDRGYLGATWFENSFVNSPSVNPITFVNQTVDAATRGLELEALWRWGGGLETYANYTYLDTLVTGGGGFSTGLPGDRLPLRPRHSVNGGALYAADRWKLGAEFSLTADRRDAGSPSFLLDDFLVARLFGNYDLNETTQIYGRAENLFDERYLFTRGFEGNGFGIFGGLRIKFGN